MGKKTKKKRKRKTVLTKINKQVISHEDENGIHFLMQGPEPSSEMMEELTKKYQENIRNSPLWEIMVSEFGPEKAEEVLKKFQAKIE